MLKYSRQRTVAARLLPACSAIRDMGLPDIWLGQASIWGARLTSDALMIQSMLQRKAAQRQGRVPGPALRAA